MRRSRSDSATIAPNAPEGDDWTSSSDHGSFHEAGIPFVYFGVEDHRDYHRPTDDVEQIVPAEFDAAVATVYAAIRAPGTPPFLS